MPHPVPVAVPQYVKVILRNLLTFWVCKMNFFKVPIPAPYPYYTRVQHLIEVPVYRIVPEIVEKPLPYTVEKPFPSEF